MPDLLGYAALESSESKDIESLDHRLFDDFDEAREHAKWLSEHLTGSYADASDTVLTVVGIQASGIVIRAGGEVRRGDSRSTPGLLQRVFAPDVSDVERLLRQEWWMNHGCPTGSQYGDDGEMSCGACGLDFKRMELPALYSHVVRARQMAGAKAWEALNG